MQETQIRLWASDEFESGFIGLVSSSRFFFRWSNAYASPISSEATNFRDVWRLNAVAELFPCAQACVLSTLLEKTEPPKIVLYFQ